MGQGSREGTDAHQDLSVRALDSRVVDRRSRPERRRRPGSLGRLAILVFGMLVCCVYSGTALADDSLGGTTETEVSPAETGSAPAEGQPTAEPVGEGVEPTPEPTTDATEPVGEGGDPAVEPVTEPEPTGDPSEPPPDATTEPVTPTPDPIVEPVTEPEPTIDPTQTIDSPQTPAEALSDAATVRAHPPDVISQYAAIWFGSDMTQPLLELKTAASLGTTGQRSRSNGAGKDDTSREIHRDTQAPLSDPPAPANGGAASGSSGGSGSSSGGFAAVVALMALASQSFSRVLRLFLSPPRVTALIADLQRPG
jgi:outer membrane biosynthesis protein TonB